MNITNVNLSEKIASTVGLSEVRMSRIGKTVILAGKNGSGKTRLLNLIREHSSNIVQFHQKKSSAKHQIAQFNEIIASCSFRINQANQKAPPDLETISQLEDAIASYKKSIEEYQNILSSNPPIETDTPNQNLTIIDFVPHDVNLEDWSTQSKDKWMEKANGAKSPGVSKLNIATLPLIQQVIDRWFNNTHPLIKQEEKDVEDSRADYSRLQEIIKSFLGAEVGRDKDGYSTLFGKPIARANLSAGQKIILQLCAAIFAQGGTISNYVIFMDEPENHLHPSAVIDLLDAIKEKNKNGQIWIATHSIPLLSHYDPSFLWFVEDGVVRNSGKRPEKVLEGLLGDKERIRKLKDFADLPDELARNRFAFECLCPPTVVQTDSNDPQSKQLFEQLQIIWANRDTINVLDYGVGKGRMIANLSYYPKFPEKILNYQAYDVCDNDKEICLKNIALSFDDYESRYHNSIDQIRTKFDDNYFDVVIMSNVLHEISYSDWCGTFSSIRNIIRENGYLLIIEDCKISTGELPNKNGFIVLNTLHLKKLFCIPSTERNFLSHDARFDSKDHKGRLMAHLIPSQYLQHVSAETIKQALLDLKNSAMSEIRKIRNLEPSYINGLSHSFWIQQLANSLLCLTELGNI